MSSTLLVQRIWKTAAIGTVVVGATLMGAEIQASADAAPHADVLVIHATKCDKKNVDPAIGDAPPALGYDCLKLLERKSLPLAENQPSTTSLPNGRTFQLVYGGKAGSKYKVSAAISNADKSPGFTKLADISADANKPFNVGGFAYQGGVLMLTTKIVP